MAGGERRRWRDDDRWRFFLALPKVDPWRAALFSGLVLVRGVLPAASAVAVGAVVADVQAGRPLGRSLLLVGVAFVLLQVMPPLHEASGADLGWRTSAWLYDRLTETCVEPPGLGHLEDPELVGDLTVARDFDLGMTGPPMHINLGFVATGLVELVTGLTSALLLGVFAWWAPIVVGGAWLGTHHLLRESSVWRDRQTDEVRMAERHAEYAYRLAVDPPAAKELRLFGLAGWVVERFLERRRRVHALQHEATRLRERPLAAAVLLVVAANALVLWAVAEAAADGRLEVGRLVVVAQAAVGASAIAFGGLSWALDGAAAPIAAVARLRPAMAPRGSLASGDRSADGLPAVGLRFRDVSFAYPSGDGRPVLDGFDLEVPAGSSLAIVGQNGAGKTTLAKLLCRLYDPTSGRVEVDGVDLRQLDVASWRSRVTAVFQDFTRLELPLRDNVAPTGAPDEVVLAALADAGAGGLADLGTPLSRAYEGGTDLSGGQWQRVAIARALCAVRQGAGVVLLDEPTAQLDVRGEAEVFERVLAATRTCTTILVSHRFSTVRHADRICVVEGGRVVELGSHDELMALGGRYRTMFDLQASRFTEDEEVQA